MRRSRGIAVGKQGGGHMQQSNGGCGRVSILYWLGRCLQSKKQLMYG